MQKLHIKAQQPNIIPSCKQYFSASYPRYGGGTIELNSFGDYTLITDGISEASARRTNEYKNAYNKVTMDMLHAYEKENRRYTSMHREMTKVYGVSKYNKELMDLSPNKYQRKKFTMPKPTKANVEDDLRKEVSFLNFDMTKSEKVSEKDYIRQHLNRLTEERQQGWQEACDLFNQIEDAREERENAKSFAEYQNIRNQKQEFIEGNEDTVKAALSAMCSSISVPYNIGMSYDYKKNAKLLDVELVFEDGVNVPNTKAVILASGKISIKNKQVKEMVSDKTQSTLSCVYYIAANMLNVSPNIQYLRSSVYDKDKHNPLLWVEFDRDVFARINPKMVGLHSDILGYPHVLDFKTKGDAIELSIMKESLFINDVKSEITRLNDNRIVSGLAVSELANDNIAISFEEAQRLTQIPMMCALMKKAIAVAKDNGWSYVAIDKRYKGVIEELNETK